MPEADLAGKIIALELASYLRMRVVRHHVLLRLQGRHYRRPLVLGLPA